MQCVWGLLRGGKVRGGRARHVGPLGPESGLRGGDFVLGALGSHVRAVTGSGWQRTPLGPAGGWEGGQGQGPGRREEHTSSRGQERRD